MTNYDCRPNETITEPALSGPHKPMSPISRELSVAKYQEQGYGWISASADLVRPVHTCKIKTKVYFIISR